MPIAYVALMQRHRVSVDAIAAQPDAAGRSVRPLLKEEEAPAALPAVHAVGDSPGLSFHNRPLLWRASVSRHPKKLTTATIAITIRTGSATHRHPELPECRLNLPVSGTCGISGGGEASIAKTSRKYISDTSLHIGGRLSNLRGWLSYGAGAWMQALGVFLARLSEGVSGGVRRSTKMARSPKMLSYWQKVLLATEPAKFLFQLSQASLGGLSAGLSS